MIKQQRINALAFSLIAFTLAVQSSFAQKIAAPVTSLRVYLFDCGLIKGEDPLTYGLKKNEVKDPDMVVPCYLDPRIPEELSCGMPVRFQTVNSKQVSQPPLDMTPTP